MRGTRTVRRLLGAVAALALVGPLSSVARPDVAAAAPTGYVTMSDGVSIAVNVRMPTNYVPGLRYPTVFEMSAKAIFSALCALGPNGRLMVRDQIQTRIVPAFTRAPAT